jgi:hypothetical protein
MRWLFMLSVFVSVGACEKVWSRARLQDSNFLCLGLLLLLKIVEFGHDWLVEVSIALAIAKAFLLAL